MLINGRATATAGAAEESEGLKEWEIVEGINKSFHLAEDRQADLISRSFSLLESENLIWKVTISGYCHLWDAEAQRHNLTTMFNTGNSWQT